MPGRPIARLVATAERENDLRQKQDDNDRRDGEDDQNDPEKRRWARRVRRGRSVVKHRGLRRVHL